MSEIHPFTGQISEGIYTWEGVEPILINNEAVQNVLKHVLVGPKDGAPNFIIRYFQVPIGGSTFHHAHPHEHGMVILHGKASIQINDDFYELDFLDSLFVSGDDVHQVTNTGESPLGFLCVIPSGAE